MSVFHNHYFSRGPPIGSKHIEGLVKGWKGFRFTSWWFFNPTNLKNIRTVKLDHFPRDWGENKTYLKPPPSSISLSLFNLIGGETRSKQRPHPEFSFPKPNRMVLNLWIHNTVDGSEILHQLVDSLSHYLQGFLTYQLVQDFFHQQYYPSSL